MLLGKPNAERIRERVAAGEGPAAPYVNDVEVISVIRRDFLRGLIDRTAASQAVGDLREWPGERFEHQAFLDRAWQLRATVRSRDAMYIALAEALRAPLLTTDRRLANATGLHSRIEVL